ncbi:hypothetical protein BOX15_Mlig025058g1 [Macrostomum lignano]|uniref:Uncharacterized protein n=1 Tax=Macrostomum lignano TaxID=282301 RepID=A0A267F3B9_9PLAT|nr:hypothetical protein BOX15_Mlig025058g1 [Macrostomum lignano]
MPRSPSGPEPKRPKKRHARRILRFLRGLFAASPTAPPEILASGLGGGGSGCGCGCCTGIGGSGCPAADGCGLGDAAGVPQIRVRVQLPPPQPLPQPPSASQCEHPCCLMHRQEGDEPASTSRWTDSRSPSPSHPQPETIDNAGNADGGASDDLEAAPGAFECPSIGPESTVSTTTLQPAEPPSTPRLSQMSKPIDNASSSTSASASASAARRLTTTTAALITPVRTASLQQAAALIGPPTDEVDGVRSCRLQPAPVSLRQVVTMSGGGGSCLESGAAASAERETPPKLTDGSTLPPAVSAARQLQLPKVQWLFQTSHSAAALPPQPTTRTADAAELDEPVANVETGRGGCRLLQLHRHQSAVASSASQRQTLLAASTPPQPQPPRQVKLRPLQLSELRPEVSTNHRLGDCCSSLRPSDGISDKQQPQQQQQQQPQQQLPSPSASLKAAAKPMRTNSLLVGRVAETVRRINAIPTAGTAADRSEPTVPMSTSNTLDPTRGEQHRYRLRQLASGPSSRFYRADAAAVLSSSTSSSSRPPNLPSGAKLRVEFSKPDKTRKMTTTGGLVRSATSVASGNKPQVNFSELLARFEVVDRRRRARAAAAEAPAADDHPSTTEVPLASNVKPPHRSSSANRDAAEVQAREPGLKTNKIVCKSDPPASTAQSAVALPTCRRRLLLLPSCMLCSLAVLLGLLGLLLLGHVIRARVLAVYM